METREPATEQPCKYQGDGMGFFSKTTGNSKLTKAVIPGRVAALMSCVIQDIGVTGLIAGSILLKSDCTVEFRSGNGPFRQLRNGFIAADVRLEKLLTDAEYRNHGNSLIDRLTCAVMSEFQKRGDGLIGYGDLFERRGQFVFQGVSAQYRDAEQRGDKDQMDQLLMRTGELHYLMETFESFGVAKEREFEMKEVFAGGVVNVYERHL